MKVPFGHMKEPAPLRNQVTCFFLFSTVYVFKDSVFRQAGQTLIRQHVMDYNLSVFNGRIVIQVMTYMAHFEKVINSHKDTCLF